MRQQFSYFGYQEDQVSALCEKRHKVSPLISPAYCLEKVSRLQKWKGKLKGSPVVSLHWRHRFGSLRWPKQLEFVGKSTREERNSQKENSGHLQRVSLKSPSEYLVHAYEEISQAWGENHPIVEKKKKNLWCSPRAKKNWISTSQMDNHIIHSILSRVFRRYRLSHRVNWPFAIMWY